MRMHTHAHTFLMNFSKIQPPTFSRKCFSSPFQAEIGPGVLNLTDTSTAAVTSSSISGSRISVGNTGKVPARPAGGSTLQPFSGGRKVVSSPASKPSSKASHGRGKAPWRVEDLEGELERKIKMLEKERQEMRKETQGQHEKIDHGLDVVSHRVAELEHSESWLTS